jgi:hypothetical protein
MTTTYAIIVLLILLVTLIPIIAAANDIFKDKRPLLGVGLVFVAIHYALLMILFYLVDHDTVGDCLALVGAG